MSAIDQPYSHSHGSATGHGHANEPHVMPLSLYYMIFAILLALLILTVAIAEFDLGSMGLAVAMIIATIKAILILMYFMHVKFSPPLVWVFSTAAFAWLVLLFVYALNDYFTRMWMDVLGK
jgi:cytochrome c oxidase subunit 4